MPVVIQYIWKRLDKCRIVERIIPGLLKTKHPVKLTSFIGKQYN